MQVDLTAERLNRGLTLAQVEKRIGLGPDGPLYPGQLWRIEMRRRNPSGPHGTQDPHPRVKFAIASFYGYRVTDIWPVREAGEPEPREAA